MHVEKKTLYNINPTQDIQLHDKLK